MIQNVLDFVIISLGDYNIALGQLLLLLLTLGVFVYLIRFLKNVFNRYARNHQIEENIRKRNQRHLVWILLLTALYLVLNILSLNYVFTSFKGVNFDIYKLLLAFIIILLARISDSFISSRIREELIRRKEEALPGTKLQDTVEYDAKGSKIVQYIIIVISVILLIQTFSLDYSFEIPSIKEEQIEISISNILIALLVIMVARLVIWLSTHLFLFNLYKRKSIDIGKQYAYNQLYAYVIYLFAVIFALQFLGINMTLLLGGAAALLVGIGIALQQTINDFFCGIVLLFERSVQVGDFLEVSGNAGTIRKIGLRSSAIETREKKTIFLPNSLLVNTNVINWSEIRESSRFDVRVSVAYGSDTALVSRLLLEAVQNHSLVTSYPKPFVRFLDFGESSLDFGIFFFSNSYMKIEDVKSDIRYKVDQLFRENGVVIPFPQRDIHLFNQEKSE